MSNHTPGPWKIETDHFLCFLITAKDGWICDLDLVGDIPEAQRQLNAMLICAAPEMLKVLREIYKVMDLDKNKDLKLFKKVGRVLKKAQGYSS